MTREEDLDVLVGMLPGGHVLEGNGWPATVRFHDGLREVEALLYVSRVGEPGAGAEGTARPSDERRFQNPGQNHPIHLDPARPTLLLGLAADEKVSDEEGAESLPPVIAAMDAGRHAEKDTRVSIQMKVDTLREAAKSGYHTQLKGNGELIVAFRPELIGAYIEAALPLVHQGEQVTPEQAEEVRDAFALVEGVTAPAAVAAVGADAAEAVEREERSRVLSTFERKRRDARFRKQVIAAYGGRCAMCGLALGLAVGAHIDPVEANGPDHVTNGLALCPTHHTAFDRHIVLVEEDNGFKVTVDEDRVAELADDGLDFGVEGFREGLFDALALPTDHSARPHPDHFKRRRKYYFPPGWGA